jgi:hypothetical protein
MVDIEDYDPTILDIYSPRVLEMIKNDEEGWEELVPTYVDTIIKENRLFGYSGKNSHSEQDTVERKITE